MLRLRPSDFHLLNGLRGLTIKAICRELSVSRKVVRKVIRSEATEFRYEREAQPLPKIGPWREKLDQLLLANEGNASRERLTLIRLFEELRGLGYDGGYDAVRRYARQWSKERGASTAAAYVPLTFEPGKAYQFDWSHEVVLLSGVTVIVKAAHVRLCHSRMMFVRVYPRGRAAKRAIDVRRGVRSGPGAPDCRRSPARDPVERAS
jgi:transposase